MFKTKCKRNKSLKIPVKNKNNLQIESFGCEQLIFSQVRTILVLNEIHDMV